MNEIYRWRGGQENLLRHGDGSPVTLLVLPALFEEANRMRRFTVSVMRYLAVKDIGTILPDLPGTGESDTALCDVMFSDWQDAVCVHARNVWGSISFRGGALLDGACKRRWQLAPDTGERLLRDLMRATAIAGDVSVAELERHASTQPTRLAGHLFSPEMYLALQAATVFGGAQVSNVAGPKLWRAAEPSHDAAFANRVADDIVAWVKTCAES